MIKETSLSTTRSSETIVTRRGKIALYLAGGALSAVAGYGAVEATTPDFSGEQTVRIDPGDTLWDISNEEVEGGSANTGATVHEIIDRNPDVFQDGGSIGPEDVGQDIVVPERVD